MRFGWMADEVRRRPELGLRYELYRPGRAYDALVFVKSMGPRSRRLAETCGCPYLFEINVNYFQSAGTFHYEGMAPTPEQMRRAEWMARHATGVIAASPPLLELAAARNSRAVWIPDNVNLDLVPPPRAWDSAARPLRLVWSGQPVKLFELLAMEPALRARASHIRLELVTHAPAAAYPRWEPALRKRFEDLLRAVPHVWVEFRSVRHLLEHYATGGVAIAPRFMDNTYNVGHTEWKITLAMACGRVALAGPLASYERVAERAGGRGLRICRNDADWQRALDEALDGRMDWAAEEAAARTVVAGHYATRQLAPQHAGFVRRMLEDPR